MSVFTDFDAAYGDGFYTGMPSGDGGTDIFHDGVLVDHMHHPMGANFEDGDFVIRTPNHEGGIDTLVNGHLAAHTQPNVMGGTDVYHDGHLAEVSIPNVSGGEDIYDDHMQIEGMTMPNVHGGEDYLSWPGNEDSIMQYDDPLLYTGKLRLQAFDAGF